MKGLYQASLHLSGHADCVLERLVSDLDETFTFEIESVDDDLVRLVLYAGPYADAFYDALAADESVERVERVDRSALAITKRSCGTHQVIYENHGTLRRTARLSAAGHLYHVLFFRRDDLLRMIEGLRELGTVTLDELEDVGEERTQLTSRQRSVITHALRAGYYEWPREVKSEELAAELGISRATLHEHLRKAERKLIADSLDDEEDHSLVDAGSTDVTSAS